MVNQEQMLAELLASPGQNIFIGVTVFVRHARR